MRSPDYQGMPPEQAVQDFRKRIQMYKKYYNTLGTQDHELSYVQVINAGERVSHAALSRGRYRGR